MYLISNTNNSVIENMRIIIEIKFWGLKLGY